MQLSSGGAVTDPFDARLAVLDAEPDAASLTLGTVNFGRDVFSNPWDLIVELHTADAAARHRARVRGLRPRPAGHAAPGCWTSTARRTAATCTSTSSWACPGGMPGTAQALTACLPFLPAGATFAATGVGRTSLPVMLAALSAGGHLRVGMEDTLTYAPGEPVRDNAQLVARAAGLARIAQRPPMSTDDARALLGHQADGGTPDESEARPRRRCRRRRAARRPPSSRTRRTQPMSEVRRLRREAEQEEVNLSYTRRLLQGRLDIVRRELQRRAEHDGRSLVDLLPEILSEKGRGPAHGLGRHQTVQPHGARGVRVLGQRR